MRKLLGLALAVAALSGAACAPQKCALEPRYAAARAALERSTRVWNAGDMKAADRIAQDGIAKLGRDYSTPEYSRQTLDDSSQALGAARDMELHGDALDALITRRGVLHTRLAIYRDAHKCAD